MERARFQLRQGAGESFKSGFQRGQRIGRGHESVLGSESVVEDRKQGELRALREAMSYRREEEIQGWHLPCLH